MSGKAKIEALTNAWYGYTLFATLAYLTSAVVGSGLFAFFTVPLVIGVSLFCFFVNWAVGKLLLRRSGLTRVVVVVLSPIGILLGSLSAWQFLSGRWSFGALVVGLVAASGAWMHLRSLRTLLDRNVKAYFG